MFPVHECTYYYKQPFILDFYIYFFQHCFICRRISDFSVSEAAGIKPRRGSFRRTQLSSAEELYWPARLHRMYPVPAYVDWRACTATKLTGLADYKARLKLPPQDCCDFGNSSICIYSMNLVHFKRLKKISH